MMVASRIASVLAFLSIQLAAQPSPQTAPPPQTRTGIASDLLSDTRKAAEAGDARAQFNLGFSYYLGVPAKDYAEAARWFRKSADQGGVLAQQFLALMYEEGRGVPQDLAEAARWYRKAADQGDATAQFALGGMYAHGQGVAQDYAEAVRWYRKAADQGFDLAQHELGAMYALGQGVAQNYAEAARWFRKAADQGYVAAQFRLGQLYFSGQGVPQDYVQAHMWVNLAAAHANGDYQQMFAAARDEVAAKMDAAQIAEAQRLAREWKPTK